MTFDYIKEQKDFEHTFKFISDMFDKNAFSSCINLSENKYKSDIIMYLYDSISCGVAKCVELLVPEKIASIKQSLDKLKQSGEFLRTRTGGKRNTEERIEMVIKTIKEC
ncbi:hypothetical protein SDC9_153667 [bioreactor metagenome]|uniref:Uncharacterized protein n=1 Tax=bioreactor metagenome TaxID=1076179 RepID=A0A645EWK1_9ZZZZ